MINIKNESRIFECFQFYKHFLGSLCANLCIVEHIFFRIKMLNIKRKIYDSLLHWKSNENRKPLLLSGARQMGKTTLVRSFASEFDNYIELNIEKEDDKAIFSTDDINTIVNAAFLLKRKVVNTKSTLLFIDEIQESLKAIKLLFFFY